MNAIDKILILLFCVNAIFYSFANDKSKLFPALENIENPDKKIQIQKTDSLLYENIEFGEYRKLIGNVILKDNQSVMWCDSAILDITANYLTAYGNPVHIKDGDTVDLWGNFLEYFGNQKEARLSGNTIMRDKKMVLTAPEFNYNTETDIGHYLNGGRMVKENTILTSQIGYYFHKTGEAVFYNNVVLKNKESTIYADSMRYNTNTEIVYFITKTKIIDKDSNVIITNQGYFNTKTEKAFFGANTKITKENKIIIGDEIDYDNASKNSIARGNVSFQDTTENITILSGQSIYTEKNDYVKAIDDPLMISISKENKDSIETLDTMYLSADTLISYKILVESIEEDSTEKIDSVKIMYGYRKVKMIRKNFSAKCDSIFYSEKDSIFKLYYNPIMWLDSTQLSGDSIYIYLKNEKINTIKVFNNAFIIYWKEDDIFNQVKGKNIEIFIDDDKMKQLNVDGNAESIYFTKDEKEGYIGGNQLASGYIVMTFKNGEIDKIKLTTISEATFTPMKNISTNSYHLEGFNWQWNLKPKNKYDVIRNKTQYDNFITKNKLYYNTKD
jgi:lipopolysaccharide export system protein LptA